MKELFRVPVSYQDT